VQTEFQSAKTRGKQTTWKSQALMGDNIKMDIKKSVMGARSGLIWLRICLSTSFYDTDVLIDFLLVVIN
jgi:hypothetical protein